jgi:flavodoxin
MADVLILVGTQTGNSEALSEDLQNAITHVTKKSVEVKLMDDLTPEVFGESGVILICSSTWGDGELPDNSLDFYAKCEEGCAPAKGRKYGNCILGDHEYDPYFCEAGKIWDKVLKANGADKVVNDYEINQGPTDDDILGAMKWSVDFVQKAFA